MKTVPLIARLSLHSASHFSRYVSSYFNYGFRFALHPTLTIILSYLWVLSTVTNNNKLSQPTLLNCGVPQGSVLGPILFILYTKPLTTLIRRHSISNKSFAGDTQLHDSCRPDQIDTSVQGMQNCISDVKTWMTSNKLKLNDDKTECLLIVSNRTSLQNPHPTSIHTGDTDI